MQLEDRELLVELIREVRRIADGLEALKFEFVELDLGEDFEEFPDIQ